MKSLNNEQEMIFPINISTNNKEPLNFKERNSQSQTEKNSNTVNFEMPVTDSERNETISNIILLSNKTNINNYSNLKILTKYKNIYVPKIYLINYEETSVYPPKDSYNNEIQNNYNYFNFFFPFLNFQNNANTNKDYLNYGYSFDQWKVYATEIKNKFNELNELVMKGEIKLPKPINELEYLMVLPSDYGGLGNLYKDHKYSNLKFYDPKMPENKDKKFMQQVKIEKKMTWFPLKPNPESLNKNNNIFKVQYGFLAEKYKQDTNIDKKRMKENINENNDITINNKNKNNSIIQNKKDSKDNKNENKTSDKENYKKNEKYEDEKEIKSNYEGSDESFVEKERSRNSSINSRKYYNYKKKYNYRYSKNYSNKYYNNNYKYNGSKNYNRYKNRYSRYNDEYY